MIDVLLPSTDIAVIIQGFIVAIALGAGFWLTRKHPDRRLFIVGLTVLAFAGFGLRALH